ncbi:MULTISPECIES: hypothetical protein [unclassified Streptomyces]|uniref:hypothetical protein n=1 Tax=unclassified Streptomyces TaxID=2593676 RepID=UPI000DAEC698|nr:MULTISPECIES: hypothetical protein [unclassified Streptomyces]PZT76719.1 hypothetical protein DNK56_25840 [Streptomyces sp. AC1-42W]PZT79326.1 hypothetical protein DNK55_06840 [Streptomyces sp. AC1-42T]
MNKRTARTAAISGAALLSLISGCSSETSAEDLATARRAQSALDSANAALAQERAAETKLIRKCMAAKGFTVFPDEGRSSGAGDAAGRAIELSPTAETARKVGYGVDPRRPENQKVEESTDSFDALPTEVKRKHSMAMDGYVDRPEGGVEFDFGGGKVMVPSKGCRGETLKAVYGDVKEYLRLNWTVYNTVKQNSAEILAEDDDYQNALSAWATCLKAKGYGEVDTPEKARKTAMSYYAGIPDGDTDALDEAQRSEIKQAKADAACGEKTALNSKAREAKSRASATSLVEHEAEITAWLELITKAKDKAQQLLRKTS